MMSWSAASASAGLFPDKASRIDAANTINAAASMVALFGRVYDPTSLGSLSMIKYTAFMTAALAVLMAVSYTHLRAHETPEHLVCRLLLEKKKKNKKRKLQILYKKKQTKKQIKNKKRK